MAQTVYPETVMEWRSDCLKIFDPSIYTYRQIYTTREAKKLIRHSPELFIRTTAAIYAFSLAAIRSSDTKVPVLISRLKKEHLQLKNMLSYFPLAGELLDQLLEAALKSKTINGIKTDVYHEAIHLSIKAEDYFNRNKSLKRRA